MNEFSMIDGGERNLPVLAQAGVPPYQPTSDAAVAAFRDLMLKRPPDSAAAPAMPNTPGSDASPHPVRADRSDLDTDGLAVSSRLAPAHWRAAAGEEGGEGFPLAIPAELMAAGVQRPGQHAPTALYQEPAPAAAARAEVAQNDEVAALLRHFSANLYVADRPKAGTGHIMVDLGASLPGSSVEMSRDGVFLNVRLHAADDAMLRLMRGGSARLLDALNKSTGLVVRLDLVERSDTAGDEA
ncbi:hypothetical protein ACN9MZ_15440 [Pseudoduganella sp. S-14]|uniref:hypothetical protein n=1 Tax=Pseudoduganella sp. S-14 TaxID=3404065 RepID=UPI003CFB0FE1